MARKPTTIAQKVTFNVHEQLVSTTDLRGIISYTNSTFCEVAGFSYDELVGHSHNIVRHPDMPAAAFKDTSSKVTHGRELSKTAAKTDDIIG